MCLAHGVSPGQVLDQQERTGQWAVMRTSLRSPDLSVHKGQQGRCEVHPEAVQRRISNAEQIENQENHQPRALGKTHPHLGPYPPLH